MSEQNGPGGADDRESEGQVSEASSLDRADEPIVPHDATAGYPGEDAESGEAQEGTAGPDAPPEDGTPNQE